MMVACGPLVAERGQLNPSRAWYVIVDPRPGTPPSPGRIVAIPEVGRLHHRFDRVAA